MLRRLPKEVMVVAATRRGRAGTAECTWRRKSRQCNRTTVIAFCRFRLFNRDHKVHSGRRLRQCKYNNDNNFRPIVYTSRSGKNQPVSVRFRLYNRDHRVHSGRRLRQCKNNNDNSFQPIVYTNRPWTNQPVSVSTNYSSHQRTVRLTLTSIHWGTADDGHHRYVDVMEKLVSEPRITPRYKVNRKYAGIMGFYIFSVIVLCFTYNFTVK